MIRRRDVGDVCLLTIDNPPVNATSQAVRQGLLDGLTASTADPGIAAVIIIGAGDHFSAGGDVRELGNAELNQPSLLQVIAVIEAANKPVIAAISGATLGGGLELGLACHWRIGKSPLKVGLPEVTLGVIPGAGGTQRLPRLVGPALALELITSGRHVDGPEALQTGLIDELCDGSLEDSAMEFARRMLQQRRPLQRVIDRREKLAAASAEMFAAFRDRHREAWHGLLAPWRAVDAIEHACLSTDGPQIERAGYLECQLSPQRAALGYLFSARRTTQKSGLELRAGTLAEHLQRRLQDKSAMLNTTNDPVPTENSGVVHERALLALADAGTELLDQGLALTPMEIDVVCVDQLGFPAHLGGPMFSRSKNSAE